jgi:hypothetical protein
MEGVGLALCPHGGGEGGGRRWLSDGGGGGSSAGKGVDVAEVAAGWAPAARSRGNRRAVRSHGPMWEKSWACGPLLLWAQANKNSKFFDLFKRISNGSDLIRLKDELPEF